MTLAWANRNSKEDVTNKWNDIIKHNFELFYKIISWNIENKVYLYRISSDLVPFADHEKWGYLWDNWRNTIDNHGLDRKSTRLNSSHIQKSRMPSSA